MERNVLFNNFNKKIDIEKIKTNTSSILGIFRQKVKKEVIDFCLYKSDLLFGLSDGSLIVYDTMRESQTLEIDVIMKKRNSIIQLEILHQLRYLSDKESILCLSDSSLEILDTENYEIK